MHVKSNIVYFLFLSTATAYDWTLCKPGEIGVGISYISSLNGESYYQDQHGVIYDHDCNSIATSSAQDYWSDGWGDGISVKGKAMGNSLLKPTEVQTLNGKYNNCYSHFSAHCSSSFAVAGYDYVVDIFYCCPPHIPNLIEKVFGSRR